MSFDFSDCVKKARDGDADAFADLYSLIYKDLYHIALCNLRHPQDAADAVSDTVLDAFTSMKKLRNPEAFKAWMIRILTAKIKKKQREYIEHGAAQQNLEDVEQEMIQDANVNGLEIVEEIARLEESERLVLSLHVVSGYSSDEIAKLTSSNANTVRSKLMRAKMKLKQRLIS